MNKELFLIDDHGVTWIRQRCRCCRAVLWEVLGDPVCLCRSCAQFAHGDLLGKLRVDHDVDYLHLLHRRQYHGACAADV